MITKALENGSLVLPLNSECAKSHLLKVEAGHITAFTTNHQST